MCLGHAEWTRLSGRGSAAGDHPGLRGWAANSETCQLPPPLPLCRQEVRLQKYYYQYQLPLININTTSNCWLLISIPGANYYYQYLLPILICQLLLAIRVASYYYQYELPVIIINTCYQLLISIPVANDCYH